MPRWTAPIRKALLPHGNLAPRLLCLVLVSAAHLLSPTAHAQQTESEGQLSQSPAAGLKRQYGIVHLGVGQEYRISMRSRATRVNVGESGLLDVFMPDPLTIIATGAREGFTRITIQYADGQIEEYAFRVGAAPAPVVDQVEQQVRLQFQFLPTIRIQRIGNRLLLTGQADEKYEPFIAEIVSVFPEIIHNRIHINRRNSNLAKLDYYLATIPGIHLRPLDQRRVAISGSADIKYEPYYRQVLELFEKGDTVDMVSFDKQGRTLDQLRAALQDIEGLQIREISGRIVLSGTVSPDQQEHIESTVREFTDARIVTSVQYRIPHHDLSVQIDCQVVEVQKASAQNLGIQWVQPSNAEGPGLSFAGKVRAEEVHEALALLASQGKARYLATPRLIVRNGNAANFNVGGEIPIARASGLSHSIEYKKYGTRLEILPRIETGRRIFVRVRSTVSQPDFDKLIEGYPTLASKEAETSLLVSDDDTFAIAGLLSIEPSTEETRVPLLGDLPLIGEIFRGEKKISAEKETIILIHPRILSETESQDGPLPTISPLNKEKEQRLKEEY